MVKKNAPPLSDQEKEERLQRYNKVVASAELSAIQLVHLSFDVQPRFYADHGDPNLGYVVKSEESYYDPKDGFAACIVNFDVSANDDDGPTIECDAKYSVAYRLSEECEEEAVKAFLRRVGIFACYPYFRALFANLDWSANTRLPPLPVHKEAKPSKARLKKKPAQKISSPKEEQSPAD